MGAICKVTPILPPEIHYFGTRNLALRYLFINILTSYLKPLIAWHNTTKLELLYTKCQTLLQNRLVTFLNSKEWIEIYEVTIFTV